MPIVIAVLCGLIGLAVGSFLNVVIHRVPAGRSIARPPSACPHCGHAIRWFDNVPVLSWLLLRGRCRDCGAPIAVRYPLVELAGGVAFALVALCFAPDGWLAVAAAEAPETGDSETPALIARIVVLLAMLWLAAASIALAAIDIETQRLPDRIVLPTIVALLVLLAAAAALTADLDGILRALLGAVACPAFYLLLRIASRGGMGMGDVKLSAALGLATAWFGWPELVVGVLAAFVLGGLFGIALLVARRAGRRMRTPFGPWMLAGAWIGIVAGSSLWTWYAGVLGLA